MTLADRPALPIDRIRLDTPGVENVVHFNNAGSALPPEVVVRTVTDHLRREAEIGGYEASDEAADRLAAVSESLGRLVGADASNMAVVENATRAWDMAVYGFPFAVGDRVLTGRSEYVSNVIALLQLEKRFGIELVLIDDDETGQIDLVELEAELDRGAAMVALTHVATSGGLVNPASEVGALCAAHGTFYVLDACQSAGQVPLDVATIGCDVLSGTGRKYLRGPRGTGFLYASDRAIELIEPPFLDLHAATWTHDREYVIRDDAKRFENWETFFAGKLGLGVAIDYALDLGIEATSERLIALAATLRARLVDVGGITVHDKGDVQCGIVTFTVDGVDSEAIQQRLKAASINTTVSPGSHARFDISHRGLPPLVRASIHYYNTESEIDQFIEQVAAR